MDDNSLFGFFKSSDRKGGDAMPFTVLSYSSFFGIFNSIPFIQFFLISKVTKLISINFFIQITKPGET